MCGGRGGEEAERWPRMAGKFFDGVENPILAKVVAWMLRAGGPEVDAEAL